MLGQNLILFHPGTQASLETKLREAGHPIAQFGAARVIGRRAVTGGVGASPNLWLVNLTSMGGGGPLPITPRFLRRLRDRAVEGAPDRPLKPVGVRPFLAAPGSPTLGQEAGAMDGDGAGIAIFDATGVASHSVFGNRLRTFVFENDAYVEKPHTVGTGETHGTAVASVAALAAPAAKIFAYRCKTVWEVMKAIDHVNDEQEICVIATACSLPRRGFSQEDKYEATIEGAKANGITMLAAAGNEGPAEGLIREPALFSNVWAVGGFKDGAGPIAKADATDTVHKESSRGVFGSSKPDFLAFYGPYTYARSVGGEETGYGTSLGVARAAGVVARLYGKKAGRAHVSASDVNTLVVDSCIPVKDDYGANASKWAQGHGALSESDFELKVATL